MKLSKWLRLHKELERCLALLDSRGSVVPVKDDAKAKRRIKYLMRLLDEDLKKVLDMTEREIKDE